MTPELAPIVVAPRKDASTLRTVLWIAVASVAIFVAMALVGLGFMLFLGVRSTNAPPPSQVAAPR